MTTPSRAVVDSLPDGALLPVSWVRALLEEEGQRPVAAPESPAEPQGPTTWRERLWTVPAETRLGVAEVAEALGRPRSYVYARTGPKASNPLPHRKLEGSVVVTAGELRAWIRDREEVVHEGRMESSPAERRLGVA